MSFKDERQLFNNAVDLYAAKTNPAYVLRDDLYECVEVKLGPVTEERVITAIQNGVVEDIVLRLQNLDSRLTYQVIPERILKEIRAYKSTRAP